ncbi:MAG TPA: glycosyltransferase, partial [Chthoniobacterales bacterium]|nr:glycosyltransferase [Chthoniobacterales bacterium]
MFEQLQSLRGFQPKFYFGSPTRFHLPLFYDLVADARPKRVVVLGFGDGQAFFTFCQAANEKGINCQCVAVRRDRPGESEGDDVAWHEGRKYGEEFYGGQLQFVVTQRSALGEVPDRSIDILLLADSDSGKEIRENLAAWESKLTGEAVVLLHGAGIEREDSPRSAWDEWVADRPHAVFSEGRGLGIALQSRSGSAPFLLQQLVAGGDRFQDLAEIYALAAARIDAFAKAEEAEKTVAAFETRQVWLDSLLTDRRKVQEIMDYQGPAIAHLKLSAEELRGHLENLRRDRAKAQLIMDSQHEQLKGWVAQGDALKAKIETLKAQLGTHKAILKAARNACRKKGRCFRVETGPKARRSFGERIARELQRLPRNLGLARKKETLPGPPDVEPAAAQSRPPDRYAAWIAEHEPDANALDRQRRMSKEFPTRVKISLLTPVHNPPAAFLAEMFASVAAQTYDNWELCVVDAASDRPETRETLRRWESRDKRIRVERLAENFGIAENTNRALRLATGEFVACLDHDDVLAPFALYELARAAMEVPKADILYSDEDRLTAEGKRHAPFFKPEWDPDLLCASMYIGHLSAYRRFLALELDGFRKEFDFSQDYDFALRATERARAIHHIPHVLYHWREHPASGSTGGKPDARRTNLAALAEAMRRRNLAAEILEYPTANRAKLKIARWPRVSVIVPTDSPTRAQACLQDLARATKYPDLEIVVVTNSQLAEALKFIEAEGIAIRLVVYEKPFNFSEKCNAGAEAATGERLIFFNDDVETDQADWIQNLI